MIISTTGHAILKAGLALTLSFILIAHTPGASAQTASVYKWVDDNGMTHFTDMPPDSATVQNTGIRYRRTDPNAVQSRVNENQDAAQANQEKFAKDSEQAAETREEKRISAREREEQCQQAKELNKSYDTAHRLYRRTPDGEREYLSDDEIDNARSEAAKSVSEWCN